MYNSRSVFGILALCFIISAVVLPQTAHAQIDSKTSSILAKKRQQYEKTMDSIRRSVRSQLEQKKKQIAKLKDNTEAVDTILREIKEFEASGAIPDVRTHDKLRQAYAKAAATMRKGYNNAKLASGGEHVFVDESDMFWTHWDLVPWQNKLAKAVDTETERMLSDGDTPLTVEMGQADEYRFEIKAKRSSSAGTLTVEFPLVDGKRLILPAAPDSQGDIWVLVTVRKGLVSADLGVARPLDLGSVQVGEDKSIVLRADGGEFIVESVRVKPVISGKPPEVQVREAKAQRDRRETRRADRSDDRVSLGSKWSGTFHNRAGGHNAKATVRSLSGSRIVFRVNVGNYGTRDWEFNIQGTSLTLLECRVVKTRGNVSLKNIRISGAVKEKILWVSGTWNVQVGGGGGGGGETVTLELHRD